MNKQSLKEHFYTNMEDYVIFVFAYVVPLASNVIIFRSGLFPAPNPVFVTAATVIPIANWGLPFVVFMFGVFEVFELIGGWILP